MGFFIFVKSFNCFKIIIYQSFYILKKRPLDYKHNYNYLPIQQLDLFNNSDYNLHKIVKYFNVSCILFLDLSSKKKIFKKFLNLKLINIVVANTLPQKRFDFNITIGNNPLYHYIIYTFVLGTYFKRIN